MSDQDHSAEFIQRLKNLRENAANLSLLVQQLRSTLGVIPFIGAGLSKPLGYPLWTEFLLEQSDYAGTRTEIEKWLKNNQYEEAAESLLSSRGGLRFGDAIAQKFGDEVLKQKPIVDVAVNLVPFLSSGPVMTTNFDHVLEVVFEQSKHAFAVKACGERVGAAVQALHTNQRLLIKLHGDCSDPHDLVLTLAQYTAAYGSSVPSEVNLSRPLPRLLRLVLQNRPLLFLGCSLKDDRTVRVMHHVASEYPEVIHYAVVEMPEEGEVLQRDKFLSDHAIRPIWYPNREHESIRDVLEHLISQARARATSSDLTLHSGTWSTSKANATATVRDQLTTAGYPGDRLWSLSITELANQTDHSTVYRGRLDSKPVIVKFTRRNFCSVRALKSIAGKVIAASEGKVSTTVATPTWAGESTDYVIEIQSFHQGITLQQLISQSRYTVQSDLLGEIYNSLLRAATNLHNLGVLHRDISPSNVLIAIAHPANESARLRLTLVDCSFACPTEPGPQLPVRDANYTAPEQVAGRACRTSDWYSIAATCYFLATGFPPDPSHREPFREGLKKINTSYYESRAFFKFKGPPPISDLPYFDPYNLFTKPDEANDDDTSSLANSRYLLGGGRVIESLLETDLAKRPANLEQALLETGTRVDEHESLLGVLELDGGVVFIRRWSYEVVPRSELSQVIDKELSQRDNQSVDLYKYLTSLKTKA